MNKLNFNYETEKVNESIGMSDEDYKTFSEKLADKSLHIHENGLSAGKIAEWIAENLSFTELIYMSTQFLGNTTRETAKKVNELKDLVGGRKGLEDDGSTPKGIDDLKRFLKSLSNDPEGIKLPGNVAMHTIDLSNDDASSEKLLEFLKNLSPLKNKNKDPKTFEDIQNRLDDRNNNRKNKDDE